MMATEQLWDIVAAGRDGVLATIGADGIPQLSNIYYLSDRSNQVIRFSTTTVRIKGRNLMGNPRAALHVPGQDFFNFAVVSGPATLAVPMDPDDAAVLRNCLQSMRVWGRRRIEKASDYRCSPTIGWLSSSASSASTGRFSTDEGLIGSHHIWKRGKRDQRNRLGAARS